MSNKGFNSNEELLSYVKDNNIKDHDKENRDYLNAAKVAYLSLIVLEAVFIVIKLIRKQNLAIAENFGVAFFTLGVFYLSCYKRQHDKKDLIYGIISLASGILFTLGYIGITMGA